MTGKSMDDRRQALEESFFKKENERILAEFRSNAAREEQEAELARVSGVTDGALLDRLFESGFRAETWIVISLVPLIEVAWADGEVSDAERAAVLEAAKTDGIIANDGARGLLESWLANKPAPDLRAEWKAYVQEIDPLLDPADRERLQRETLQRAQTVARAASGLLGLSRWISKVEDQVIEDLMSAFSK